MDAAQVAQMLDRLTTGQQMSRQALDQQATAFNQSLQQQAAAFARTEGKKAMSDPKHVGRVNAFSGREAEWTNWSFQFSAWINTITPQGQVLSDWARDRMDITITPDIFRAHVERYPNIQKMSDQMYATLVSLMPTNIEALSL